MMGWFPVNTQPILVGADDLLFNYYDHVLVYLSDQFVISVSIQIYYSN